MTCVVSNIMNTAAKTVIETSRIVFWTWHQRLLDNTPLSSSVHCSCELSVIFIRYLKLYAKHLFPLFKIQIFTYLQNSTSSKHENFLSCKRKWWEQWLFLHFWAFNSTNRHCTIALTLHSSPQIPCENIRCLTCRILWILSIYEFESIVYFVLWHATTITVSFFLLLLPAELSKCLYFIYCLFSKLMSTGFSQKNCTIFSSIWIYDLCLLSLSMSIVLFRFSDPFFARTTWEKWSEYGCCSSGVPWF